MPFSPSLAILAASSTLLLACSGISGSAKKDSSGGGATSLTSSPGNSTGSGGSVSAQDLALVGTWKKFPLCVAEPSGSVYVSTQIVITATTFQNTESFYSDAACQVPATQTPNGALTIGVVTSDVISGALTSGLPVPTMSGTTYTTADASTLPAGVAVFELTQLKSIESWSNAAASSNFLQSKACATAVNATTDDRSACDYPLKVAASTQAAATKAAAENGCPQAPYGGGMVDFSQCQRHLFYYANQLSDGNLQIGTGPLNLFVQATQLPEAPQTYYVKQ